MSKIYKATIYIDDINGMFKNIDDIKNRLDWIDDLTFTFEKVEEKDTTQYLEEVGDDYEWNTTDEYTRSVMLHNYFAGEERANE